MFGSRGAARFFFFYAKNMNFFILTKPLQLINSPVDAPRAVVPYIFFLSRLPKVLGVCFRPPSFSISPKNKCIDW